MKFNDNFEKYKQERAVLFKTIKIDKILFECENIITSLDSLLLIKMTRIKHKHINLDTINDCQFALFHVFVCYQKNSNFGDENMKIHSV